MEEDGLPVDQITEIFIKEESESESDNSDNVVMCLPRYNNGCAFENASIIPNNVNFLVS